jgi:hypothetical protein
LALGTLSRIAGEGGPRRASDGVGEGLAHPVDPDRLGDVLDLLLAQIVEGQRQLVADLVARGAGEADRPGLGERFQPGGDVDPVAEQVAAVDNHIADMDADAELHRLVGGAGGILCRDRRLDRDRTRRRIDRTGEVGDDAVAGGVEDAPAMLADQPV